MSCNFIIKLDTEPEYSFIVIDDCPGAGQAQAALKYWMDRHAGFDFKPSDLDKTVKENKLCIKVWTRFQHMAAVVDQAFLIKLVDGEKKGQKHLAAVPAEGRMKVNPSLL